MQPVDIKGSTCCNLLHFQLFLFNDHCEVVLQEAKLKPKPVQFRSQLPVCQDELSIETSSKISLFLD